MKKYFSLILILSLFYSCTATKKDSDIKDETTNIKVESVNKSQDPVNIDDDNQKKLEFKERIEFEFDRNSYKTLAVFELDELINDDAWQDDHDTENPVFASVKYRDDEFAADLLIVLFKNINGGWAKVFFLVDDENSSDEVVEIGFTMENEYKKIITEIREKLDGYFY